MYHIIYIYTSYYKSYTMKCQVSIELHLWFGVWVTLATLSLNFLRKYLFFDSKTMLIFETKLAYYFHQL